MAPLIDHDRVLIRIFANLFGLNAYQMIREFPKRGWTRRTAERLIKQIDETGQPCSKQHERKRTVRTPANISLVLESHVQPGARENIGYLTSTERRKGVESSCTDRRDLTSDKA